jgi:hypothetical protein
MVSYWHWLYTCFYSCSFCYKYNVERNDNIYKFMFSSIISSYGNSFLFLFSEIIDYETSETPKEAPKEKENSINTPTKSSSNGMEVSK